MRIVRTLCKGCLLLWISMMGVQCSKQGEEAVEPKIDLVDASPITVKTEGGTHEIRFTTNTAWSARIEDAESKASAWFELSKSQGEAGSVQITLAAKQANTSYDNRSAEVVIQAGTAEKRIAVTQKKKDALILSQNHYEVSFQGETLEVTVQHNVEYQVVIPVEARAWVTQVSAKGLVSDKLYFQVNPYGQGVEARETTLLFKDPASSLSDEVTIRQIPTPTLIFSPALLQIEEAKTQGEFVVRSSEAWQITPKEGNPEGCTLTPRSGAAGDCTVSVVLSADEYEEGVWAFTVKADTMVRTFYVKRGLHKVIIASPSQVRAATAGETIQVALQRSVACEVTISEGKEWIKPVATKALISETLSFEVSANTGSTPRTGKIVIRDESQKLSDTVFVEQGSPFVPVITDGWDIYTAGTYRYGPSIMIHDDGSIDAWFAASGGSFGHYVHLCDQNSSSQAVGSLQNSTVGQKFTMKEPFYNVTATSPNWGGKACGLTFKLYRWNDDYDYAENIKQEPIAQATFTNYADGEKVGVSDDAKFPAGTYLWVISAFKTAESGMWLCAGAVENVTSYRDGKALSSGNWQAQCALEKTSGAMFWDQVSYQHSTDDGLHWTEEEMTVLPTEYSRDAFSCCDPGAVFFGGYYYVGYTSTEDSRGTDNHVYVARGRKPNGPWEKWNGSGWGGDKPQPVITYTGSVDHFGAGEPSFVVLNNTLYMYYSWNDPGPETRVSTAPADDPNWPARLTYRGVAMDKSKIEGSDHSDVKYRDDIQKFQAIHTASRMNPQSYIVLWQSEDGITFEKIAELRDNLQPGLHNCGWSGDEKGHMREGVQQYIAYAYGSSWGVWNTRWAKVNW